MFVVIFRYIFIFALVKRASEPLTGPISARSHQHDESSSSSGSSSPAVIAAPAGVATHDGAGTQTLSIGSPPTICAFLLLERNNIFYFLQQQTDIYIKIDIDRYIYRYRQTDRQTDKYIDNSHIHLRSIINIAKGGRCRSCSDVSSAMGLSRVHIIANRLGTLGPLHVGH